LKTVSVPPYCGAPAAGVEVVDVFDVVTDDVDVVDLQELISRELGTKTAINSKLNTKYKIFFFTVFSPLFSHQLNSR